MPSGYAMCDRGGEAISGREEMALMRGSFPWG